MKTLIDFILEKIEPVIDQIIKKYEEIFIEDYDREMTETDKKYTRLNLIYEMLRSIEVYTKPTDKLINGYVSTTPKGSLVITATIEREDIKYHFNTEVIYAGGHNIQRLHFRYLTKTNLPKTNNLEQANQFKEKLQKLTKIDKINKEIISLENRINKNIETVNANKKLTDEEILDADEYWQHFKDVDWNTIVERGVDSNYEGGKEEFDQRKADQRQSAIDGFKFRKIRNYEENTKSLRKEIEKLKDKLSKLQ